MTGPLVGGFIADGLGWQWAFWINAPVAGASLLGILSVFPKESPRTPLFRLKFSEKIMRLDLIGSLLLMVSMSCLVSVLQNYSRTINFELDQKDVILAAVSGSTCFLFLLQEVFIRPDLGLIPRAMVRRRVVWSSSLMLFLLMAALTTFTFFLSLFFQVCSPLQSQEPGIGETSNKISCVHSLSKGRRPAAAPYYYFHMSLHP